MKQFFNLKSNFYFLQKLVFAIFCFVLGFLLGSGILKAKASDFEYSFENNPENFLNQNDWNFTNKLNELVNEVKKTGKFYAIVLSYNDNIKKFNNSDLNIYLFDKIPNNIIYENTNIRYVYKPNESTNIVRWIMNGRYDINLTENKINEYISLVSDVSNYRVYDSISSVTIYTKNWIVYDSNFDIYNNSEFVYNVLGRKVIQGDKFPTIKKVLDEKNTYTEDYRLSTKNIKQIEYTFDLENKRNIIHEFNFSTSLNLENATFDIFDYPYLQYSKDNVTYELPLNLKTDETGNQLVYFDTQINNFIDIDELKFIIPNEKLVDVEAELLIHFDSSLNYTRKVYYKDDDIPDVQFYNVYKVNDIDHIEVEFDLTDIPESALIPNNEEYFKFEMKYDIKITDDNRGHHLSNNITLDVPKIEYMKVASDGVIDTSTYGLSNNRLNQYSKYFGKDIYTNTYLATYEFNRTLKLIVNCRDIDDVYLNLKISATLNHNIKIFYRENVEDYRKYYQTIDLKGKYAVVFIPKIRLNNGENSVSSYFISNGSFRVEERDTYKNEFTLYKDPINVTGKNQYYYFYGLPGELHKNDSFYYKNLNYPGMEEATIQYDSRYFVVSLCENDYKCETIVNPNTGEEITPNTSPDDKEWTIDRIFKIVDEFLGQVRDTSDYFNECFNAFWEKVPFPLQTIIIFLYIMLHIIVFVRIGGWSSD